MATSYVALALFACLISFLGCVNAVRDDPNLVVRVAMLQMMPSATQNQTENTLKAVEFCEKAAADGADIAIFPELWNVGYTIGYGGYNRSNPSAHLTWLGAAVSTDSDYVAVFQSLAKNLSMAIAITYLQQYQPTPRNVVTLIDRFGNIVFTYAKVHTCDWVTSEGSTTPGDDFYTATLNTARGNFTIGAMICYDRENPESARILMLKGAEIIITPNACYLDPIRLAQFMVRAFENALGVAMTNYPAPYYNGLSAAYRYDGAQLLLAGSEEGVYFADFNVTATRQYRLTAAAGDAFRRPMSSGYQQWLCTQEREPSFMAPNAFGRQRMW